MNAWPEASSPLGEMFEEAARPQYGEIVVHLTVAGEPRPEREPLQSGEILVDLRRKVEP